MLEETLSNPSWRLENLYRIQDKAGRDVAFRPNAAQRALLGNLHSFNLILKARQLGFTTLIGVWTLDRCLFMPNQRTGIIAHTMDHAEEIFRTKVRYPYERLPASLKRLVKARQDRIWMHVIGQPASTALPCCKKHCRVPAIRCDGLYQQSSHLI